MAEPGHIERAYGSMMMVQSALNRAAGLLPTYVVGGWIKIWGNRDADKQDLLNLAVSLIANRLSIDLWASTMMEIKFSYSLSENTVTVDATQSWSEMTVIGSQVAVNIGFGGVTPPRPGGSANPVAPGFNALARVIQNPCTGMQFFDEFGTEVLNMSTADTGNPQFADTGTRGTWLEELITQALYGPDKDPDFPP